MKFTSIFGVEVDENDTCYNCYQLRNSVYCEKHEKGMVLDLVNLPEEALGCKDMERIIK